MSLSRGSDRIVLADVARRVGVSVSTVSRALAGDPRVGTATRDAVRRAADELRYVPNAAAAGLRRRRSQTLGLLIADLSDPVHGQIAAGFEGEAGDHGYRVIFQSGLNDTGRERRALRVFTEHPTDGVALVSTTIQPREARTGIPPDRMVAVQPERRARPGRDGLLPPGFVQTDDPGAMALVVEHLIECGYRDIAYAGNAAHETSALRRDAAQEALAARGIDRPIRHFQAPDEAWASPASVARAIAADPPDALICYDDKLALALLDAFRDVGVRVPDDVGLVGFDGIPFAALTNPRLTTVDTPTAELGRQAARWLVRSVEDGGAPSTAPLPCRLVARESTLLPGETRRPLSAVSRVEARADA